MTTLEIKKLCDLAKRNPLAAKVKAYQTLPQTFIEFLKPIAKWDDQAIQSWDFYRTALEVKCPFGSFWLVPSTSTETLTPKYPRISLLDLRNLAQTMHPPF